MPVQSQPAPGFAVTQTWSEGGHENADRAGNLYVSNGNDIEKIATGSSAPRTFVAGLGAKTVMVGLDGYLWAGGQGFVDRIATDSATVTTLLSSLPGTTTGMCQSPDGTLFLALSGAGVEVYRPSTGQFVSVSAFASSSAAVSLVCGTAERSFVQLKDQGIVQVVNSDGSNSVLGQNLPLHDSGLARPAAYTYYGIYGGQLYKLYGDPIYLGTPLAATLLAPGFYGPGATNIAWSTNLNELLASDGQQVFKVDTTTGATTSLFPLTSAYF